MPNFYRLISMLKLLPTSYIIAAAFLLTGCGARTPDIIYNPANEKILGAFVGNTAFHVRCELRQAIYDAITNENARFLHKWSAKITMTLSADEKTNISPGVALTDVLHKATAETIGLGLGATSNHRSTRKIELTWYEIFEEMLLDKRLTNTCGDPAVDGIQGDLKLEETLLAGVFPATLGGAFSNPYADDAGPLDTIQNTITFDVDFSGSATPTLKLVNASFNPSSPTLLADRDRMDQLLITLGPTDATFSGSKRKLVKLKPSTEVNATHDTGRIGLEFQNFQQRIIIHDQ